MSVNDVIATSTKVCSVDLTNYRAYVQSNGETTSTSIKSKNGFYFVYDTSTEEFNRVNFNGPAFYTDGNMPVVKDGKWYHVQTKFPDGSALVEFKNPSSHKLPD